MGENGKDGKEVKDFAWRCPSCENILGYITSDLRVLRVKYKDFYMFVEEAARVQTLCRRCGRECYLFKKPDATMIQNEGGETILNQASQP